MELLRASFTVPMGVDYGRVVAALPEYQKKWVERMEMNGWRLCSKIAWNPAPLFESGRSRYYMNAYFERAPREVSLEVDSEKTIEALVKKYNARAS